MRKIVRTYPHRPCKGCGIPLGEGYCIDCGHCQNRRQLRLRRGEPFTPTGYAGELIDNHDPKGRLVTA